MAQVTLPQGAAFRATLRRRALRAGLDPSPPKTLPMKALYGPEKA